MVTPAPVNHLAHGLHSALGPLVFSLVSGTIAIALGCLFRGLIQIQRGRMIASLRRGETPAASVAPPPPGADPRSM